MSYEVKYQTTTFGSSPLNGINIRTTHPIESSESNPGRKFYFFSPGYREDFIVEVKPDNLLSHGVEGREDTTKLIIMMPDNRYTFSDSMKEITFWLDVPSHR